MKVLCMIFVFLEGFQLLSAQIPISENYYERLNLKNFRKDSLFNQPIDFRNIDLKRIQAAIFFVTNEVRNKHKLKMLQFSGDLEKCAMGHSEDMVVKNFFSHENKYDRKKFNPNDRAKLIGITNPFVAENIAEVFALQYTPGTEVFVKGEGLFSYKSNGDLIPPHTFLSLADAVVKSWMNSPPHKKNILSENALELGCGVYFYRDKNFNQMPSFKATQNFQWYEPVKSTQ